MQVVIESISGLGRRMKVVMSAADIENEVKERLSRLAKTAKMPGYRVGKVPMPFLEKNEGPHIRQDVQRDTMFNAYREAIAKEKLHPAGYPSFTNVSQEGDNFEFSAEFEIFPEIKQINFAGAEIEKINVEVGDSDVEQVISNLQKQQAEFQIVDRPAVNDDRLTVDFVGTLDDVAFPGGTAQDIQIVLGSKGMIPGFEEGLLSAKPNSEVILNVTFPEDYHAKELAGKAAKFVVQVKEIAEPKLPALDDAFAKNFGIEEGGIERLRNEIRKNLQGDLQQRVRHQLRKAVFDKLVELNPIDIPEALVKQEAEQLKEDTKERFKHRSGMKKIPELPTELFMEEARRRVHLGLLFNHFVTEHKLTADDAQVRKLVEQTATAYQKPEELVDWYFQDEKRLESFRSLALEEQVVDALLNQAAVSEKNVPYQEFNQGS